MRVQARDESLSAGTGLGQIAFHIPGRQMNHPAEHRESGGKIGAVSLARVQQEGGDEVHVPGLIRHLQGIAAVPGEPGLERKGLLIRGAGSGGDFGGKIVQGLSQMGGKTGIGVRHGVPLGIRVGGARVNQSRQAGVPGQKERGGNGPGIAGLQIAGCEDLGGAGKIGNEAAAGRQLPDALGDEERGGAVREHPDGNGGGSRQRVLSEKGRQGLVKQAGTAVPQRTGLPEVAPAAGGVVPGAAVVFVENHAPEIGFAGRGDLHHGMIALGRGSPHLTVALRIKPFRGQAEHIPGLGKEEPVQNRLPEGVGLLPKRFNRDARLRGQEEGEGDQRSRGGQKPQRGGGRVPVKKHQGQGGCQTGKQPRELLLRAGKPENQRCADTQQGGGKEGNGGKGDQKTQQTEEERQKQGDLPAHQRQGRHLTVEAQRQGAQRIGDQDPQAGLKRAGQHARQQQPGARDGGGAGQAQAGGRQAQSAGKSQGQNGRLIGQKDLQHRHEQTDGQQKGQQKMNQRGLSLFQHADFSFPCGV